MNNVLKSNTTVTGLIKSALERLFWVDHNSNFIVTHTGARIYLQDLNLEGLAKNNTTLTNQVKNG